MTLPNHSLLLIKTVMFLLIVSACSKDNSGKQDSASSDCLYNAPVAIFEQVKDSLMNYNFEVLGTHKTTESFMMLDDQIEIIQSGCNEISQEFRFQTKSSLDIVDYSSDIFNKFSALDPALFALNQFASEFQNQKELIKTGQKIQFSEIIYLKMDETPIGDSRLIRILMTSEKN